MPLLERESSPGGAGCEGGLYGWTTTPLPDEVSKTEGRDPESTGRGGATRIVPLDGAEPELLRLLPKDDPLDDERTGAGAGRLGVGAGRALGAGRLGAGRTLGAGRELGAGDGRELGAGAGRELGAGEGRGEGREDWAAVGAARRAPTRTRDVRLVRMRMVCPVRTGGNPL
ncbi:MAG: hypothetical protein R3F34_14485 [Planctomycetota bacterium]